MNFRNGFNFFKGAAKAFCAPKAFGYPKNLQKVVNKALIR